MKKITLFGKSIPLFVLILLVAGLVSGALVTYLSNQAKATATVESPFELKIAEGAQSSTSTTEVDGITWDGDNSISFDAYGGSTITFTGYINKLPDFAIAVNEKEVIRHVGDNDMTGLDEEFDFFGARYWRAEGKPGRIADYSGDPDNGWDPIWDSGLSSCRENTGSSDCVTAGYCGIKDGICYFTDEAFNYNVVGGQLVSDYAYTYPAAFTEEIMQVVATFDLGVEPGTYEYTRQVNKQP